MIAATSSAATSKETLARTSAPADREKTPCAHQTRAQPKGFASTGATSAIVASSERWQESKMAGTRALRRKLRGASLALVACAAALALGTHAASPATAAARTALAARTLNVSDDAHLHYVRESGSDLLEEGQATGGLPGRVRAQFNVGATVYASFSISTPYGSISGSGSGELRGTGVWESFGGTMTVTHGTGRYSHAHGHGGFYGAINRHTYASTVQTTGTLDY
jgi:hypothetical protein